MTAGQPAAHSDDDQPAGDLAGGAYISITRVILLTIASYGIYPIYWLYRTWKQYRDHTGDETYPVWHALTQLVPIYQFFRLHAHGRTIKELMEARGIPCSLRLWMLVALWVVYEVSQQIAYGDWFERIERVAGTGDEPDLLSLLWSEVIGWGGTTAALIAICLMQLDLNHYWAETDSRLARSARFGKGEILCVLIGAGLWVGTFADYIL